MSSLNDPIADAIDWLAVEHIWLKIMNREVGAKINIVMYVCRVCMHVYSLHRYNYAKTYMKSDMYLCWFISRSLPMISHIFSQWFMILHMIYICFLSYFSEVFYTNIKWIVTSQMRFEYHLTCSWLETLLKISLSVIHYLN